MINGKIFRHPKTSQEKKINLSPEHKPFVRAKRNNLPDAWSDIPISTWNKKHVSWKHLRSKKYRTVSHKYLNVVEL